MPDTITTQIKTILNLCDTLKSLLPEEGERSEREKNIYEQFSSIQFRSMRIGLIAKDLPEVQKNVQERELQKHIKTLEGLKRDAEFIRMGGRK